MKANKAIVAIFKFKNDKVCEPETCLGAKVQKKSINGKPCQTISSVDYINAAIKNIEDSKANNMEAS